MFTLTDTARTEIERLRTVRGATGPVRLGTRPGGCAGTKYHLEVDATHGADDTRARAGDLDLVCRAADLPALRGVVVDFNTALVGGGFRYENPNAGGACGCGASFQPLVGLGDVPPGASTALQP